MNDDLQQSEIETCEACGRDFAVDADDPASRRMFCPNCTRPYLLED